ncbi:MAG: GAF domain-containing protein [Acidobacteria bacterium]|nr:GAF domain-containing protein [Acidobacteriota bacterium]
MTRGEELLGSLLEAARRVIPRARRGAVLRAGREAGGTLTVVSHFGYENRDVVLSTFPVSGGDVIRAIRERRAQVIAEAPESGESAAAMIMPLVDGDVVVGALLLVSVVDTPRVGQEASEALSALARAAAIAVNECARLEAEARHTARLTLVREVGKRLSSILSLEEVLQQIATALVETFGYYHASIFLADIPAGEIILRAKAGRAAEPIGLRLKIAEHGITAAAAASGETLLANDVSREPRYRQVESLNETASELAVPIKARGRVVGVIDVQSVQRDAFEEEDVTTIEDLADQTASTIENAGLYEEAQQQTKDLISLYEAGQLFSSTLDHEEVLQEITRRCVEALDVDTVLLRLVEADCLQVRGSCYRDSGEKEEVERLLRETPIRVGEGIAGKVAQTGEAAVSGSTPGASATLPAFVDYLEKRRWLVVPLKVRERIIGVLTFIARNAPLSFSQRQLTLARGIANQAAIAIENARLFQEARSTNAALRESEERFRTLFHGVPVGLYRSTPDGDVLEANLALVQMLGYPDVQTLQAAKAGSFYTTHQDRDAWRAVVDTSTAPSRTVVRLRRRDGTAIWAHDDARAVCDENGRVLYYEGSLQDITEQKALEEQLRHSQKMEAVGRLAGGVAHDFNNILTTIRGYVELTLRGLKPEDPLGARLKVIEREAGRASTLTRQLLTFGRRQPLELTVIDLNETVLNLSKLLEKTLGEAIRLRTLAPGAFSMYIMADGSAIQQMILNLCLNARDAMPAGGELTLSTRAVIFDPAFVALHPWAECGHYVVLSVADTGVGMDKQTQERAFEPFFTTKERGTGLGLSMVYALVRQHRGFIHLASEPGSGTTFEIYLPRILEKPAPQETQTSRGPLARRSEAILVAEDEEAVRELLQSILEERGYTVLVASNGKDALRVFDSANVAVQLALLDMVMPEMGGIEVCKELQRRQPGLKYLFMSGYSLDGARGQFLRDSRAEFIKKPFSSAEISLKVRQVLDS